MNALKWTWKIIWRLVLVPIIVTFVVMLISLFFINDTNQQPEYSKAYDANYGSAYQHYSEQEQQNPNFVTKHNKYASKANYLPQKVEMEEDDFDLSGLISTIALLGTFVIMLIYTIMDIRTSLKKGNNAEGV